MCTPGEREGGDGGEGSEKRGEERIRKDLEIISSSSSGVGERKKAGLVPSRFACGCASCLLV